MGTKPCLQRYQKSRISAGGNVVPGAAGRPHLFAAIGLPEKRQRFYRKEHLYPAAAGGADVDAIQYSHGKNDMVICGIRSQCLYTHGSSYRCNTFLYILLCLFHLFLYSLDGIVAFSNAPLYIASIAGVFSFIVAIAAMLFIIIRRLVFGDPVAGWASTVVIILFIGGIQLLSIGILGLYLSKLYLEAKDRPIYLIGESNIEKPTEKN